jgi:NTP pyrophosphatase (non-canonical NTP hydrolase)
MTDPEKTQPTDLGDTVWAAAQAERERAHAKHGNKSMESSPWTSEKRLRILLEEVGEVAKEFNDADIEGRAPRAASLYAELVQVTAMAGAWAEAARMAAGSFVAGQPLFLPPPARTLNCPVCGNGEEGDCLCPAAEALAKAEWEAAGRALYEAPWERVSDLKRAHLIIKALPQAVEQAEAQR